MSGLHNPNDTIETMIKKALEVVCKNRTVIVIAHRLSTIFNADKIIVLDEGKAVGIGTHETLMQTCEVYREIYFSQYGASEEVGA